MAKSSAVAKNTRACTLPLSRSFALCVAMTARHIEVGVAVNAHTLLLLLTIFVACFAACHRNSSSRRRHATCVNLFTVIVCCQRGEKGVAIVPWLTYIQTAAIIRLGWQPAKRLARLSHSSPAAAAASASVYLDIIRLAALQSPPPPYPAT